MNNQQNIYIAALVVCLIVGLYLIFQKAQPAYSIYQDVQTKSVAVENTRKQIEDLKSKKEAYEREEKVSTKPVYKSDIDTRDQMSSFGVMFEDVIQSAKYNGLKLRSIAYNLSPSADVVASNISSEYNICAINMQLIGTYMQLRSYFQDIYNYPYLINLDKITINPYEGNKKILIADISVILYSAKSDAQKALAEAAEALSAGDEKVDATAAADAIGQ